VDRVNSIRFLEALEVGSFSYEYVVIYHNLSHRTGRMALPTDHVTVRSPIRQTRSFALCKNVASLITLHQFPFPGHLVITTFHLQIIIGLALAHVAQQAPLTYFVSLLP